jgi:transmembrane sensor
VEKWLSDSRENHAEFLRLKKLWESSGETFDVEPADVDVDRAWEKVDRRISMKAGMPRKETLEKESPQAVRSFYFYAVRVAAVLLVGIILSFLAYRLFEGRQKLEMVAGNTLNTGILPDSSRVTLNVNSKLTYPEKFKPVEREVTLSGEAFFDVKHIEDQPFIVQMKEARVQVLGTAFNIRDVEGEPDITVTVTEGQVRFSDRDNISFVYLGPDEKGVLHRNSGIIEKFTDRDRNELFWKTGTLLFRDTQLSEVFNTIERTFRVTIRVKNKAILNCRITGKFNNTSAGEILDNISPGFNFTVQKDNNTFIIDGNGCTNP